MVSHTPDLSIWEMEAREFNFKVILGCVGHSKPASAIGLKTNKQTNKKMPGYLRKVII